MLRMANKCVKCLTVFTMATFSRPRLIAGYISVISATAASYGLETYSSNAEIRMDRTYVTKEKR